MLKGEVGTPYGKWDPRSGCYRLKDSHYKDALEYFKESKIHYEDDTPNLPPFEQIKVQDWAFFIWQEFFPLHNLHKIYTLLVSKWPWSQATKRFSLNDFDRAVLCN